MIQGTLEEIYSGRWRKWTAIVSSNIVFGSGHVINFGTEAAVSLMVLGCFWGWIYARNKTLVGPIFSHIVFGVVSIFVMGLKI